MFCEVRGWELVAMASLMWLSSGVSAAPTAGEALGLTPKQSDVSYDKPDAAEIAQCTIKAEKIGKATAWVVRAPNGDRLRLFSDTDGDMVVDTWSYYQNGLEVYRDIDSDHDGKYDQFRWFHNAGTRWGLNTDQDKNNTIDNWKLISPEETAEQVVDALRTANQGRFKSLLLTTDDIRSLGLPATLVEQLKKRIAAATATFEKLASREDFDSQSQFSDFGGLKPGMVPAGTRGSTKDLMVYENAWAMIKTGNDHQQLQLGTMVSIKGAWKLIDGPALGDAQTVASGFFFVPGGSSGPSAAQLAGEAPSEQTQEILSKLEKLDQKILVTANSKKPALNAQRAGLLKNLAEVATSAQDRQQWLRQLADMVSAAAQAGEYPDGIALLKRTEAELSKQGGAEDLVAYFQFHRMLAEYYGVTLARPDVDYAKAQAKWQTDLEAFVEQHPHSAHGAEALRMLAMGSEMTGDTKKAIAWYQQILDDYRESPSAAMARGAMVRLGSEGRVIELRGKAIRGAQVDLKKMRGQAIVIQYWTSSSDICRADQAVLKDLYAKYGRRGLEIIGVNLDYSRDDLLTYLKANRLPWPQLYEPGGFENRLATEMGVVTVPLMLMVGPDGKVISSNIQAAEIEAELKKLTPKQAARR